MFDWLDQELRAVRTNKFFMFDPPDWSAVDRIESQYGALPPDYVEFLRRFGAARLFRRGLDLYGLLVIRAPKLERDFLASRDPGRLIVRFGYADDIGYALFEKDVAATRFNEEVVVETASAVHRSGMTFSRWLKAAFFKLKSRYGQAAWKRIEAGPPPFTAEETEVVEAIKKYRWKQVGVTPDGKIRFEVHNGSELTLPFLSVGIKSDWGRGLIGGVWLPVGHVCPGQTAVVEVDCYRDLVPPHSVEAFGLPLPGPEDRQYYWEFRRLQERKAERS